MDVFKTLLIVVNGIILMVLSTLFHKQNRDYWKLLREHKKVYENYSKVLAALVVLNTAVEEKGLWSELGEEVSDAMLAAIGWEDTPLMGEEPTPNEMNEEE